jgi:large subunit ribosomal protein L22
MKAYLKNYRQAPRKVRLVADLVRGKKVKDALILLAFTPKRAADQVQKVILSAVANAKQKGVDDAEDLIIKDIHVDKGMSFVRYFPRARGRGTPIQRESSHITVALGEKTS